MFWGEYKIIEIPDDSRQSPAHYSMWNVAVPPGELYDYICYYCRITWRVRFPRFDKVLQKTFDETAPMTNGWRCVGCCTPFSGDNKKFLGKVDEKI